jgi:nucleoside-triphosphate--adenylate kinase
VKTFPAGKALVMIAKGSFHHRAKKGLSLLVSSSANQQPGNVIILGAPGGGKGTISNYLKRDFDIAHISTGDILRSHVKNETEIGRRIQETVKTGKFVDDSIVFESMINYIKHQDFTGKGKTLLFDGYPRTVDQAIQLQQHYVIGAVISLEIPHNVVIERLSNRWIHVASGRTYSYDFNPPKTIGIDDVTGDKLTQRDDDKPEVVRSRLETYDTMKAPILNYFEKSSSAKLRRFHGTESKVIYPVVKRFIIETVGIKEKSDSDKGQH